jgi:hypothetical protein
VTSFNPILAKWKGYNKKVFLSDTGNNYVWYSNLMLLVIRLDAMLKAKLKSKEPKIIVVSSDNLCKIIIFLYSLLTKTSTTFISPKHNISLIISSMSIRNSYNVLIIDADVITRLKHVERDEGIGIIGNFAFLETSLLLLEKLSNNIEESCVSDRSDNIISTKLNEINKLVNRNLEKVNVPILSVLSPGTTSESSFVNLDFDTLQSNYVTLSTLLEIKEDDVIAIVADFESYPTVFGLMNFIKGSRIIVSNEEIKDAEDYIEEFKKTNVKPTMVMISSNKFKLIWDSIMVKVYSNKIYYALSKSILLSWISDIIVRKSLSKVFGKSVTRVHILNEELGFYCLDILKRSKISFTSSYGLIEQGNFFAYKNMHDFKDKETLRMPGGRIVNSVSFINETEIQTESDKKIIGEVVLELNKPVDSMSHIVTDDLGILLKIKNKNYLYVFGRASRHFLPYDKYSLDLTERILKDQILIRDCLLQKVNTGEYNLIIEPREELLNSKFIGEDEFNQAVRSWANDFESLSGMKILNYAIVRFDAFKNIANKLEFYLLEK